MTFEATPFCVVYDGDCDDQIASPHVPLEVVDVLRGRCMNAGRLLFDSKIVIWFTKESHHKVTRQTTLGISSNAKTCGRSFMLFGLVYSLLKARV